MNTNTPAGGTRADTPYTDLHDFALMLMRHEAALAGTIRGLEDIGTRLEADGPGGYMDWHAEEYLEVAAKQLEESARQLRGLKDYTRTGVDRNNAKRRQARA